jgi:hypothetical protein
MINDNLSCLEDWLFFYDPESNQWKATLIDDYNEAVIDPKLDIAFISGTSISMLTGFIVDIYNNKGGVN